MALFQACELLSFAQKYKEELSNGLDQLYDGLCVSVAQRVLSSPNRASPPYGEEGPKGQMPGPWIVGGHNPGYGDCTLKVIRLYRLSLDIQKLKDLCWKLT